MGLYKGPSCKICRRAREKLFLKGDRCHTAKCAIEKRNYPPGQRGTSMRKISEFGRRLREKQKLRFYYGVSESQMRIFFKKASRQKGITGHNLISLFERRLDNVIFRSGLAASRSEGRVLVGHGHFMVNDRRVDVASFIVKEGDVITIRQTSHSFLKNKLEVMKQSGVPEWMAFDAKESTLKINTVPKRENVDVPVEEQLIVEFYSR